MLQLLVARRKLSIEEISASLSMNSDSVRRIVESLRETGFVLVEVSQQEKFVPSQQFVDCVKKGDTAFPEYTALQKVLQGKNASGVTVSGLDDLEKASLKWFREKGIFAIEGGKLISLKTPESVLAECHKLSVAFALILDGRKPSEETLAELIQRKFIMPEVMKLTHAVYTGKSLPIFDDGFDVSVPATDAFVGKSHPLTIMKRRVSRIMAELGFEEMDGNIIESSFWNFDALFQPQNHPARDLADTFYLEGVEPLPDDAELVERVRNSHEQGWKYAWSPFEAQKRVLRTHTTALSARYLATAGRAEGKWPKKLFAVGRVFRNEATDYKHLAEFHQVEGIIAWEGATFRDLLGILKEFYLKLGFEKIRFRPSYFPYTEPSVEIEVYFEPRKQWLELGGAGIFRPEVSKPLAGIYPVLAWGLSLERPLMLLLGLEDIRLFYRNDMDFLRDCRLELE